jgi:MFS transporter, OFA family, oxalate/formate antiporter
MTAAAAVASRTPNRWLIAVMGTCLQVCLGTVYAWSYFQDRFTEEPLKHVYQWSNSQVAWIFSTAICCLGLAAAWGGINLAKYGPRKIAMTGGLLFGLGYLIGALALHMQSLALLYVGYGVIGGIGLGLGYVTPVATAAKWFPDRKGLVTGMVVMGFGFGAILMSKVLAPTLVSWTRTETQPAGDFVQVFAILGAFFLVVTLPVAWFLRNPPAGYSPPGYTPPAPHAGAAGGAGEELSTGRQCVFSLRFAMMWIVFFCNIAAGIAIIGFQSPLMQDLWKRLDESLPKETLVAYGATLIAVSSLFNGAGRFFWGTVSDKIGRVQTFRIMLASQIIAFALLMTACNPWVFGALVCYVLLCYGGGFGTMPSFVLDVFGSKMMAVVYGVILTAWAAAGVVGPQIVALIKDAFPKDTQAAAWYSFLTGGCFLALGLVLSFFLSNKRFVRVK